MHYWWSVWLLARIVSHALYTRMANPLRKKKEYTSLILMSYVGTIWHDLATDWYTKKRETQKKVYKINHLIIFLFSLFFFSGFHGHFGLLVSKYASFAFLVDAWLNFNTREDEILYICALDWACIIGRVFGSWPELHCMHYMHGQILLKRGFVRQNCNG